MFGLIAEEVEQVDPDLVTRNEKGEAEAVRYDAVNAMLLNEFIKEHRKNEEQEKTIAELKSGMTALAATVKEQASQIQRVSAQLAAASPSRGGLEASKFATGRIRGGGPAPQVVNNPPKARGLVTASNMAANPARMTKRMGSNEKERSHGRVS
jgi:hypothetical protein